MARKKEMCSLKSNEPGAGIVLMSLDELHSFEGHPFKVERNQELFELRNSIEKEGVLVPLLVRKKSSWQRLRNHIRTQKKRGCTLGRSYGSSGDYPGTG
mgnify:CR=1 FL=1